MREVISKDHSIKFRIDQPTEDLLDRSRQYVGFDRSKFIRQCIREKAEAIIAEHEKTSFSKEDWHSFFSMIDNPPEPTSRMKKAFKKHRSIQGVDHSENPKVTSSC